MAGDRFVANSLVISDDTGPGCPAFILAGAGYGVHLATTAEEAQAMRQALQPALIVLSAWLPDSDGMTVLRNWARCADCTAAVVLLTPAGTRIDTQAAARLGVAAILAWPSQPEALLRVCRHSLAMAADLGAAGDACAYEAASAAAVVKVRPGVEPDAACLTRHATLQLDQPYRHALKAFEHAFFQYHLACEQGSVRRVANKTGIDYSSLYRTLKQSGLPFGKQKSKA